MSKRKPDYTLRNTRHVTTFRKWLAANGAKLLDPTNHYELIRFRGTAGLSVIYSNERGRPHKMTGQAEAAWTAFKHGETLDLAPQAAWISDPEQRPVALSDADLIAQAAHEPITIAFLMERDAMPMREASVRLFGIERRGLLVRSGGEPGCALTWSASAEAQHAG